MNPGKRKYFTSHKLYFTFEFFYILMWIQLKHRFKKKSEIYQILHKAIRVSDRLDHSGLSEVAAHQYMCMLICDFQYESFCCFQ